MVRAKDIIVKVIPSNIANDFVKKHHYSGKVVNNSQLHFGAFLNGKLHGVMSYGCSLDKRKVQKLVVNKEIEVCQVWIVRNSLGISMAFEEKVRALQVVNELNNKYLEMAGLK